MCLGENDCEYCEAKDSVEIVSAEDWQTEYCYKCGNLTVTNPQGDECFSSEIPSHLQNQLLN